jgi:hypothetical protein
MSEIRIVKTKTCSSLSGKSKLTYNIGTDPGGAVHLRVQANSGGGFFSQEWIALDAIDKALADVPDGVTAFHLVPLFKGYSINSPGFLLAVLKQENLLIPMEGKPRRYLWQDTSAFLQTLKSSKRPPR